MVVQSSLVSSSSSLEKNVNGIVFCLLLHLCVTFVVSTSGAPQCARVALKSRSLMIPLTMTSSFVSWMQLASFARNNNNLPFLFDFGDYSQTDEGL